MTVAIRKVADWWHNRGRVERCPLGGVAALLVLCVVMVGGRRFWRSYLIARELSRIRAAGEPASAVELRRMYETQVGEPNSLVYSVGTDGVDDGGVGDNTVWAKGEAEANTGGNDLAFRVTLPAGE